MRHPLFTLTLALTLACSTAALAQAQPGVLLIKLEQAHKTDADARAALAALPASKELGISLKRRAILGWLVATLDATTPEQTSAALERLQGDKGVVAVDRLTTKQLLRVPNDTGYPELWGFHAIDLELAWNSSVGLGSQRIGMVDSGINRDHAELTEHDAFGYDFISEAAGAGDGNGRDADYSDTDLQGGFHGSHVAGTMVASANNGIGVPGINWGAGLVTARALGAAGGSVLDIAEAAWWLAGGDVEGVPAIGGNRVSVINLSLGADEPCGAFEADVYTAITGAGVSVVAAAGNTSNNEPTGSPANCPGVIAVAAANRDFDLAFYSNFDARIDVVAPGGDGFANDPYTSILSVDGSNNYGYVAYDGTSMASPHVAGVVSLMQALNPTLSPRQIKNILVASPYTCGGCNDEAFLYAPDALAQAAAMTGELDEAPAGNGSGASCPAHATLTSDGEHCQCNDGYVVNSAGTGCVQADTDGGDGCPAHSTPAQDGYCYCDEGYMLNAQETGCVEPDGADGRDDKDDDDDEDEDDEDEDEDDYDSLAYLGGCSSAGRSSLGLGVALLALLRRRR